MNRARACRYRSLAVSVLLFALETAAGAAEHGERIYSQSCAVCHGADGGGAMLGVPDLAARDSPLLNKDDEQLVRSTVEGVQKPGVSSAMPPKAGNPALNEQDIRAAIVFMRRAFAASANRR